jgi:hydrogenase expression/formation protein HypD
VKFIDEYQNVELVKKLAERISAIATKPSSLMEFCGGHTHAIMKYGLRQLMPKTLELKSGPGCPVCVTAIADLDRAIALAHLPGVIFTSFGDLIRVPGSHSSLQEARSTGANITIVYSVSDALKIAGVNPEKAVIFAGIGFETTAPSIAAAIITAKKKRIENFYVLSLLKLTSSVMKALLDSGEVEINGIIGPGHISVITGSYPYEFIPQDYHVAYVISGFEPLDILLSINMLVEQINGNNPKLEIAYRRGVKPQGNGRAQQLIAEVFQIGEANWRGIGNIPSSGLKIRQEYQHFDAERIFPLKIKLGKEPAGCRCGDIIRGVATPSDCKLFGKTCTPENPVGPCMVSSEGACAAHYAYGVKYE